MTLPPLPRRPVHPTPPPAVAPLAKRKLPHGVLLLLALAGGLIAGGELYAQQHPNPEHQATARSLSYGLATMLGIVSSGWRR